MAESFVEHINLLASKLPIIEESNEIFDEGVIPVLEEIAALDLAEVITDLKKGNYLGKRKIDINLILNMLDVDETLIERDPDQAEAIWTDVNKAVHYDKAIVTFVGGEVIELPFTFDGSPVTVTTHGDLLAQLARLDYVYAKAQVDSIYQLTVGNSTDYTVTIDTTSYTFTSDVVATRENIIAGIANMINSATTPVTALVTDNGTKLNLTAKVPGNPFFTSVSNNMAINTIQANQIEGPVETAFLAKLQNTLAANFAEPVVGEIVRLYDVIGVNSNIERIQLNAVSGSYKTQAPEYYWAKTTSSLQAITNTVEHLTVLLPHLLEISLLSQNTTQIKNIGNAIVELLNINTHLSKLINIDSNIDEIVFLSSETNSVKVVANDIASIKRIDQNINKLVTIYDNIVSIGIVSSNIEAVKTIRNNITALQVNYSNINALKDIGQNISSIVSLEANLPTLNPLLAQIDNVVLIAQNIATVLRAGQNVETIENYKNEAIASQEANEILNQQIAANTQTVNEKTEIVLLKTEEAKSYAQQASDSESQSLLYKEAALIASQQSLNSAQLSEQSSNTSIANADRAESVLSTISSIALIPLWEESTDLINKDYTKGTQVVDPFDVEIYISKNDVIDSRIAPSIDSANWKKLLGVKFNIDGGYANTLDFTQTLDGGTANG